MWGLPMCAMWVGFSSFLRVGRKKQNKFPSNLHCPVKKLNPFFRYLLSLSYLSGRLSFYTCCQLVYSGNKGNFYILNLVVIVEVGWLLYQLRQGIPGK